MVYDEEQGMEERASRTIRLLETRLPAMGPEKQLCPICDEIKQVYLFEIQHLRVIRCAGCGLISLDPPPSMADVDAFYGERRANNDPLTTWLDTDTEREGAFRYLDFLKRRGLSSGRILLVASPDCPISRNSMTDKFRIDPPISISDLENGNTVTTDYDAVMILYQLEKSRSPIDVMRQIHGMLKTDGILLVSTPSVDSWSARFFKSQWTEWRPENQYYFDRSTIQSLLIKSGFSELWMESETRKYTLEHVHERAVAYPRTLLTDFITLLYRFVPASLHDLKLKLKSSRIVVLARKSIVRDRPLCSIVVPAFNEEKTFPVLMESVLAHQVPGMDTEVIVVESNSGDATRECAMRYADHPHVKLILQEQPKGKGNAVREALSHADGDFILIQDADLEYDQNDYDVLLEPLASYRAAFVLGTRHRGHWKMRKFAEQEGLSALFNIGHVFFRSLINILYRQKMSDPFTMFKVFRRDCLYGLKLECNRFDFDHELVIKLVRKGYSPLEVPVNYVSRSYREGKKVRIFRDPLTWLWVDLKYRFVSPFHKDVS
jgi:SAM-dependent methyltransferase